MYYISRLTKKYVKVVLGGDGGDELFGGYDRYYGNILISYYTLIPEAIRKNIIGKLIKVLPESFWYRSYSHQLRWVNMLSYYCEGMRYAKSLGYFYFVSDEYKKELYTPAFIQEIGMFDPEKNIQEYYNSDCALKDIDRMLYTDSMTRMPDHPNMILDRMTMAHGLEARSPFLDHKLVEFSAKIPVEYKVRGLKRRYIQTIIARKYLPKEILKRPKQGFSSPLPYMLKDEFEHLYSTFLKDSTIVKAGIFRENAIQQLINEHMNKKRDHGQRLWLLCNIEIWYRMYIEGNSNDELKEMLIK
jgi:asparagine synthase (glutamine-hydrolysing)